LEICLPYAQSSIDGEKEQPKEWQPLSLQFSKQATVENLINKIRALISEGDPPNRWIFTGVNQKVLFTEDDATRRLTECLPDATTHILTLGDPTEGMIEFCVDVPLEGDEVLSCTLKMAESTEPVDIISAVLGMHALPDHGDDFALVNAEGFHLASGQLSLETCHKFFLANQEAAREGEKENETAKPVLALFMVRNQKQPLMVIHWQAREIAYTVGEEEVGVRNIMKLCLTLMGCNDPEEVLQKQNGSCRALLDGETEELDIDVDGEGLPISFSYAPTDVYLE